MGCVSRVPLEARAADRVWAFRKVLAFSFTRSREEGEYREDCREKRSLDFTGAQVFRARAEARKAEQSMELCITRLICIKNLGLSGTGPPTFVYLEKLFLVSGP